MTTNSTAKTATPLDLSLYLVTGENPVETVRQARHATCIQVRSKPISARDLYALAEEIARIALPHQKILIDDRVDVALALRARGVRIDGVHIGQDDLPVADARRLLGEHAIIGLTTGTRELVERANTVADLIDYIGAGPFRPPRPKPQTARRWVLTGCVNLPSSRRFRWSPSAIFGRKTARASAKQGLLGLQWHAPSWKTRNCRHNHGRSYYRGGRRNYWADHRL